MAYTAQAYSNILGWYVSMVLINAIPMPTNNTDYSYIPCTVYML